MKNKNLDSLKSNAEKLGTFGGNNLTRNYLEEA